MFAGFLSIICNKMQELFAEDLNPKEDLIRFHFRYLANRETLSYETIALSFTAQTDRVYNAVSTMNYCDLIEEVNNCKQSLVYSANKMFVEHKLKDKWENFITVIPQLESNNYTIRRNRKRLSYPLITFGVTTNNKKFDNLLYCMDYFSIRDTLDEILDEYTQVFRIDLDDFCNWVPSWLERDERG